ncbi:MAG: GNAT family N-acetyltransferase [candidate division KSB1 bacterium]|nr:GNAT family N-acetyltransferase [candidate division KSB1 bacterium]
MNVRVITDYQKVNLRDQWNSLVAKCNDNFFLTYEVVSAWWRHFSRNGRELRILLFEKGDELVGIAPFFTETIRMASILPAKCWYWLGVERLSPDHMDLIYSPEHAEELVDAFIQYLESHIDEWDAIHLQFMREESAFLTALLKRIHGRKIFLRKYHTGEVCPFISLPESYETFYEKLKGSFRYRLRRGYKEWQRRNFTFQYNDDSKKLAASFKNFVRLHQMRWQMQGKQGNFHLSNLIDFHQEILHSRDIPWKPVFFEIVNEHDVVASLYTFMSSSKFFYYQMGYDPKYRQNRLLPGKLLLDQAIRFAISKRLKEFDFLRGNERYKFEWKPWVSVRREPSYLLFHQSFASLLYAAGKVLRYKAARKLKRSNGFSNSPLTQPPSETIDRGALAIMSCNE